LLVEKHGLLVFVGDGYRRDMAITAVAAPIIFILGVVVVLLIVGMVACEWIIRQSLQQFLARINW